MPDLEQVLAAGPPATVDDVVALLDGIVEAIPAGDGVACFATLYAEVTRSVGTARVPGTDVERRPRTGRRMGAGADALGGAFAPSAAARRHGQARPPIGFAGRGLLVPVPV